MMISMLITQTVYYFYISSAMGNASKGPQDYEIVRNYRQQDWEPTQRNEIGEIWRNKKTHELAEIYRLYNVPSIEDMNRYQLRASEQSLVNVYHIALTPNQGICFNEQFVRLLIQYIPVKLEQVSGLQLEEALTILAAVFKGFNTLTTLFGAVQPHQNLIGFNQWGKAKVWLNKSHNNNFPQQSIGGIFDKSRVQTSHVRKIFDLIQRKTQAGQLPQNLKELFRANNPNYSQAVLIVERYAYQNELSLQRYIRTDILIRRSSVHQPNIVHSRKISNESIQIKAQNRPELKRMHSLDALHFQKLTTNPSQSTVSIPLMHYKENFNFSSGFQKKAFYNSGSPKITFQKSSFIPTNHHTHHQSSLLCNESQKSNLVLNKSDKFSRLSIFGSPQQSICISSPVKQAHNKKLNIVHQITETLFLESPKKEQQKTQQIVQTNLNLPQNQNAQYRIQIRESTLAFEAPQADTMRSIIDKVGSEVLSNKQNEQNKHSQQFQGGHQVEYYEQQRQEDIQVTGTFNYYKAQNREQPHLQHSLEQIGEEEDFSKDKENDSQIRMKENYEPEVKASSDIQNDQVLKSFNPQGPIGFESFAVNKVQPYQLASFAPNLEALKSIQNNQNVQNVHTSKSLECNQQQNEVANSIQSIEEMRQRVDDEQQEAREQKHQASQLQQQSKAQFQPGHMKRASIDLYYTKNNQVPFYAQYTPVQSKFDVVVKRDSILSRESEREGRASAFTGMHSDEEIQNYIRNKYNNYISDNNNTYQKEDVKVGRVQSQYQKHYVKESQGSLPKKEVKKHQRANTSNYAKPQARQNKISNILQKPQEDFLDVNFLQKSLDKRYSSNLIKKQEQDQLNIAKLDEGLMKFSTSKASLTSKDSKKVQSVEIKQFQYNPSSNDYVSKWDHSTGFEYSSKNKPQPSKYYEPIKYIEEYSSKYTQDYSSKPKQDYSSKPKQYNQQKQINRNDYADTSEKKRNKKSVRIQNTPTHQFVYQLSSSDFGQFANSYKSPPKPTEAKHSYGPTRKREQQKKNLDEKYNKYVKNTNKVSKLAKTPSIATILSGKGDSRLMLSPIPQKRWEDDGRLSYDHLRSFLWG